MLPRDLRHWWMVLFWTLNMLLGKVALMELFFISMFWEGVGTLFFWMLFFRLDWLVYLCLQCGFLIQCCRWVTTYSVQVRNWFPISVHSQTCSYSGSNHKTVIFVKSPFWLLSTLWRKMSNNFPPTSQNLLIFVFFSYKPFLQKGQVLMSSSNP